MESGVRILKIAEEHTWDRDSNPQESIRVTFKVDEHGPFTKLFPKDKYDSLQAELAIDDFARGIKRLTPPA